LHAPQRGEVVYAARDGRRGNDADTIQEGSSVRERQLILKLPDLSQMKVNVRIHESKIRRIRTGLPVRVTVQSFADEIFRGILDTVSPVPMQGHWPNYDLREYEASVRIIDMGSRKGELKPGMSASVEILVDQHDDVLQIPTQAAINVGEKYFAFVLTESGSERRELKIGDSNDAALVVNDGVAEGEQVILNPRTQFAEEIAELESRYGVTPRDNSERVEPNPAPADGPKVGAPAQPTPAGNSGPKSERKQGQPKAAPADVASPAGSRQKGK
jgi:HlyD family secretion protein